MFCQKMEGYNIVIFEKALSYCIFWDDEQVFP